MAKLDPRKRTNLIPQAEKGKCRWCGKGVPKGRRSWCSQECVDDALIRAQPAYARKKVEERDKGVCALCNLDTREVENTIRRLGMLARNGISAYCRTENRASKRYRIEPNRLSKVLAAGMTSIEMGPEETAKCRGIRPLDVTTEEQRVRNVSRRLAKLADARLKSFASELIRRGFDGIGFKGFVSRSLWDADHIVPVVKGGGGCGLENYRTLCVPCHKDVTRQLAAERAAERKTSINHPELPI